jgi:hypothetical protein
MKTLNRLILSVMLIGLAVLSTAVAGSAYGGIATSRSAVVADDALLAETPQRVFLCRIADGAVTSCALADSPASP